jgi:hypothetical protein
MIWFGPVFGLVGFCVGCFNSLAKWLLHRRRSGTPRPPAMITFSV